VVSRYSVSSTIQLRKGSTTDSDANDDKQEVLVDVATSEETKHHTQDVNLACSSVVCKTHFIHIFYLLA